MNRDLMQALNYGLEFSSCVIVGVVIGIWIDKKFECFPVFLVIFILLGSIAGCLNIVKRVERDSRTKQK